MTVRLSAAAVALLLVFSACTSSSKGHDVGAAASKSPSTSAPTPSKVEASGTAPSNVAAPDMPEAAPAEAKADIVADTPHTKVKPAKPSGARPISGRIEKGCQSPAEPGCQQCCIRTGAGCTLRSGSPTPPGNGSPPWYNGSDGIRGPCPKDCKPCATCSLRDEWEFASAQESAPSNCDCTTVEAKRDPCFAPRSCACFCAQISTALKRCPHLKAVVAVTWPQRGPVPTATDNTRPASRTRPD